MSPAKFLVTLITSLTLITLSLFSPPPVSAQDFGFEEAASVFMGAVGAHIGGTAANIEGLVFTALDSIGSYVLMNLTHNPLATGNNQFPTGLIPTTSKAIAYLYDNPPATTTSYIAYVRSNFLGSPVYAQGAGFTALNPVLTVWTAFRNLTYFFFVIIFVAVGFMIMFRSKINPQTVVTIQSALPNLILTLVLVTFSYAIAGFMIDLMYFLTYLVVGLFQTTGLINSQTVINGLLEQNVLIAFFKHLVNVNALLSGTPTAADTPGMAISQLIYDAFGFAANQTVLFVSSKIASIFFTIMILFSALRVFVELLKSFITIIIHVILSPFFLLFNALPGSNAFVNWFKNLAANILVFPGVAIFIIIGGILMGSESLTGSPAQEYGSAGFVPPLIGAQSASPQAIQALIGFGFILLMPSVIAMIKDALKVEPFKYEKDIWAAVGAGAWPIRYLVQQRQEREAMKKQEQMLKSALNPQQG